MLIFCAPHVHERTVMIDTPRLDVFSLSVVNIR
jgi:hypothetical protein